MVLAKNQYGRQIVYGKTSPAHKRHSENHIFKKGYYMRDTFYTINYHGVYIHGCFDRALKREVFKVKGKEFKSLHAAKIYATKLIKEHDAALTVLAARL